MDEEIKEEVTEPLEVTIKDKPKSPDPSFDYDDYNPTDAEILDIEKEIQQNIVKRTKQNG